MEDCKMNLAENPEDVAKAIIDTFPVPTVEVTWNV
jgi:hypothetical protein